MSLYGGGLFDEPPIEYRLGYHREGGQERQERVSSPHARLERAQQLLREGVRHFWAWQTGWREWRPLPLEDLDNLG